MGRRLTMVCVQVFSTIFITPHIEYHIAHSFSSSVVRIFVYVSYIRIFIILFKAFIPLWILPSTFSALSAGAFCIQFGVQGAWGVVRQVLSHHYSTNNANRDKRMQIPIHLAEMSPPAYRATFPGVAYQLGNVRHTIPFPFFAFSLFRC